MLRGRDYLHNAGAALYSILYRNSLCNGHYSAAACPRVHCRALQLYSTLQLYSSTASTLYSTLHHPSGQIMASGRLASWMRSLRRGPQRLTALVDRETLQTSAPWVGGGVLRAAALADDVGHHLELAAVRSYFPVN